jgi:hypothetical protein
LHNHRLIIGGCPGFPNPGPDPEALAKEELELNGKNERKILERQRRLEVDRARIKAMIKADKAKRDAEQADLRAGRRVAGTGFTPFGDFVENKRRHAEEKLR